METTWKKQSVMHRKRWMDISARFAATGKRYSLLYYSELPQIKFQNEDNIEWLNNELNKKENLVIIKNKDIPKLPENMAFKLAEKGVKYSIIEKLF